MKGLWSILAASSAFAFMFSVAKADAAIRVKCEKRGGDGQERSRASVDARDLDPDRNPYTLILSSGGPLQDGSFAHTITIKALQAVGADAEFGVDFDSNADDGDDIHIDESFIIGGTVKVEVKDGGLFTTDETTQPCRSKN